MPLSKTNKNTQTNRRKGSLDRWELDTFNLINMPEALIVYRQET